MSITKLQKVIYIAWLCDNLISYSNVTAEVCTTCAGDKSLSQCPHPACWKQGSHVNTPACFPFMSSPTPHFLLSAVSGPVLGGKHRDQTSGHMRNESGALCRPGARPPGLLAWGESNTWHLSPHIPFTANPTPIPCMGKLKRNLNTAQTQTLVLLVLSNNSPGKTSCPYRERYMNTHALYKHLRIEIKHHPFFQKLKGLKGNSAIHCHVSSFSSGVVKP